MTKRSSDTSQADRDNRSRQLDPEHDAYWQSRGEEERPEDWKDRLARESQDSDEE